MNKVYLVRGNSGIDGTPGEFLAPGGQLICKSLELPWLNNRPSVSCIPAGEYLVRMSWSPRFRKMLYLVENVPGRSGIRIHSANYAGLVEAGRKCDLLGCIAPGLSYMKDAQGQMFIASSRVGLGKFLEYTESQDFILHIIWGEKK